jgi:hypothetical protein
MQSFWHTESLTIMHDTVEGSVRASSATASCTLFNRLNATTTARPAAAASVTFNRLNSALTSLQFNRLNQDAVVVWFNRLNASATNRAWLPSFNRLNGMCWHPPAFNRLNGSLRPGPFNRLKDPRKPDLKRKRPGTPGAFSFGAFETIGAAMSP